MAEQTDEQVRQLTLTDEERKAVASLRRLAKRWPKSLMLASMDGALYVLVNDEQTHTADGGLDQSAVVGDAIHDIPNTGGGW